MFHRIAERPLQFLAGGSGPSGGSRLVLAGSDSTLLLMGVDKHSSVTSDIVLSLFCRYLVLKRGSRKELRSRSSEIFGELYRFSKSLIIVFFILDDKLLSVLRGLSLVKTCLNTHRNADAVTFFSADNASVKKKTFCKTTAIVSRT